MSEDEKKLDAEIALAEGQLRKLKRKRIAPFLEKCEKTTTYRVWYTNDAVTGLERYFPTLAALKTEHPDSMGVWGMYSAAELEKLLFKSTPASHQ